MLPPENVGTALAPGSGGPLVPPPSPASRRSWLVGGLGVLVAAVAAIAIVIVLQPPAAEDGDAPLADPGKPGPRPKLVERAHDGSGTTVNDALFQLLDETYAREHGGYHGTRDEALAWLDEQYAKQLAQQNGYAANQHDPDAVFAVDIKRALAAGQVEGPSSAPVTIVEAWDFACPYCRRVSTTMAELRQQYGGKLRIVYMNMIVHPQVQLAHRYGCAAGKQGKFVAFRAAWWPTRFDVYATKRDLAELGEPKILELARKLKLDVDKLRADANSDDCRERIDQDRDELMKFHVNATPTFFINGKHVGGAMPKDAFEKVIDERLHAARMSGVADADYYEHEVLAKGEPAFRSKAGAPQKPPTRADALAWFSQTYGARARRTP